MICSNCGSEVIDNAKFCGVCGYRFPLNNSDTLNGDPEPVEAVSQSVKGFDIPKTQPAKKGGKLLLLLIPIILVLIIVLIGVAIGIVYLITRGNGDHSNTVSYYAQDAGVIGAEAANNVGDGSAPYVAIEDDRIKQMINNETDYTTFGVYVHNLTNGYTYSYNGDNVFLSSAMAQVVILDTLSRVMDDENLDPDTETLYFSYLANGKEAPTSKGEDGSYVSIKKCVEDVAVFGDNNKSNHLVDYIGRISGVSNGFTVINQTLEDNGYNYTDINRKTYVDTRYVDNSASPNVTTPREIGEIFENLIKNGSFGSETYMKNIFKSVSNDGSAIGLKKYVPSYYSICNANALNSQSTNDVAIISDGNTEVVVVILSTTEESKTKVETTKHREAVQEEIVNYILDTQFGY